VQAEKEIFKIKLSEFTDHVIVYSFFDGKYKTILFDSKKNRVKQNIGNFYDFTEEYLFINDKT